MEKETNNIITKNIKNYNNFSYHQHQEIEKKENEKIEDFQSNFTSNEIGKYIFNKLLRLIKKEVFWGAVPLIFSIVYFILNISYKFSMRNKFNLPVEYFKVGLIESLIYLFLSIIFMFFFLLFFYMLKKAINEIFSKEMIKDIIYIILQFIFIIVIVGVFFILLQPFMIERFITEEISIIFVIWTTFFIANFLSEDVFERGVLYFSINCFLFSWIFYEHSKHISFIFLGFFLIFFIIFFTNDMWQVDIELYFIFFYVVIYLLYVLFYFIFIIYIASFVMTERIKYEIFYKDKKTKVIITTYEGKYLITDCRIDYKNNKLIINTEDYEFIDINEAKKISYISFNETPIIETDKNKKEINK